VGVLLAVVILLDINQRYPRLAMGVGIAFLLLYSGIVGWNSFLLVSGM
jgi:hypothetical protein